MVWRQIECFGQNNIGPLCLISKIRGPKPFKTLDMWLKHSGFYDFVKKQWATYNLDGTGLFQVHF